MKVLATSIALIVSAGSVSAATLSLSGVQGNNLGSVSVPEATITHETGGVVQIGPPCGFRVDSICFINPVTQGADAGGSLEFVAPVTNLTFEIFGNDFFSDSVTVSAFDGNALQSSQTFDDNGIADFTGIDSITRLVFVDNDSDQFGVGYAAFDFEFADVANVPLPATALLMLAALAGLSVRKLKLG